MTIVVDTSVLVDHLRGDVRARDALVAAAGRGERIVCSVVTRVEVLAGMRPREAGATRQLFDALEWAAVDVDIAEAAGEMANRYLRSHPGVDPVDFLIAATAMQYDATLWTRNVKHFPMFAGLTAPY